MKPRKGIPWLILFAIVWLIGSLALASLVALLLGVWPNIDQLLASLTGSSPKWSSQTFVFLALFVASQVVIFGSRILGAITFLGPGDIGILVVLGERIEQHILTEGPYWIPPLSRVLKYDGRQRQLILPETTTLSMDKVPITYKGQIQVRVTNPYRYSNVTNAEQTLLEQALDACRAQISQHSALEVPTVDGLAALIRARIVDRCEDWGLTVSSAAISELRLPTEYERYGAVLRMIQQTNPEISARRVLDALQAADGAVRRLVFESESLEGAAAAIVASLRRRR